MAHRYRLIPTPEEEAALREHGAHARFVWSLAVEQQSWWRPGRGSAPGAAARMRQLAGARAAEPWLREGSSSVQQQALRDSDKAMAAFSDPQNPAGKPSCRSKRGTQGFVIRDVRAKRCSCACPPATKITRTLMRPATFLPGDWPCWRSPCMPRDPGAHARTRRRPTAQRKSPGRRRERPGNPGPSGPGGCQGWKVSERASAPPTRRALPARWRDYTGKARTARNGAFGRVEAFDCVPAAMGEIYDLDRSCHQVAAVRAGGADR